MKKRWLSLLLVLCMVLTLLPVGAARTYAYDDEEYDEYDEYYDDEEGDDWDDEDWGDEEDWDDEEDEDSFVSGYFTYELNDDDEAIITKYSGGAEYLVIPEQLGGHTVAEIGSNAFEKCGFIKTVTFPSSLRVLSEYAFSKCTSLNNVVIPASLESAGGWYGGPFEDCTALTTASFEEGTTAIPAGVFIHCKKLTNITIPDTVTEINGDDYVGGAFEGCTSLQNVDLPKYLRYLGPRVFMNCTALKSIVIPKSLEEVNTWGGGPFEGCSALKTATLEKGLTAIPWGLFWNCTGLEDVSIPSTVTEIKGGEIGDIHCTGAFEGCINLKTVTLPSALRYLGARAFKYCTSLNDVVIPKRLEYAGWWDGAPFAECSSLSNITITSGMTKVPAHLFAEITGLESITIPETVTELGDYLFSGCVNLADITLSSKLTNLPDGCFHNCGFTSFNVPTKIKTLGTDCFSECAKLKKVTLSDTVTEIGGSAFKYSDSLEQVKWSKSLDSIGYNAFECCTALESAVIPASVNSIYDEAFSGCTSLQELSLPEGLTYIGEYAFKDCDMLTTVVLPNHLEEYGEGLFYDCDALTDVTLGSGISTIPTRTFEHCDVLQQLVVPSSVKRIEDYAFKDCVSFTDITIPTSVTKIAKNTFSYLDELTIRGYTGSYAETFAKENDVTFVALAKPVITTQPKAATIDGSDYATFTVKATGNGLKYQWQYKKPDGNWTNCSSATEGYNTATLKVQGVTGSTNRDGYQYRCVVTDGAGNSVRSSAAKLTVNVLTITTQPKDATVSGSNYATFTIKATGSGLKYQWQYLKPNGSWTNCSSATEGYNTATLKVQGVTGTTNRNGYQYRCIVTDSSGTKVTSSAAKLSVLAISTQPKAASVKTTAYATFTVKATGNGLKYQWQYKKPDGSWTNCSSATQGYNTATLKVQGVTDSTNRNGYQYRCIITDSSGAKVTSSAAKLSVLAISTQPKAASVKTTAYATFTVKATGNGLKYQWQYKKPDGSWTNCSSATTGYNTATLKVQGVTDGTNRNGYQYRCKVTDSAGNTVTSSAVKLSVLAITTQPKAASVSKTGTATFKVAATGSGLKYQWQYLKPNGSWTNCSSATTGYNTATLKVQGASGSTNRNGYQYRCVITDGAGNKITSSAVKLTVK